MITSGESMSAPTSDPGKNAVYAMKNGAVRVSRGGMRPTSASCNITNEFGDQVMVGKCHRTSGISLVRPDWKNPARDFPQHHPETGRCLA